MSEYEVLVGIRDHLSTLWSLTAQMNDKLERIETSTKSEMGDLKEKVSELGAKVESLSGDITIADVYQLIDESVDRLRGENYLDISDLHNVINESVDRLRGENDHNISDLHQIISESTDDVVDRLGGEHHYNMADLYNAISEGVDRLLGANHYDISDLHEAIGELKGARLADLSDIISLLERLDEKD